MDIPYSYQIKNKADVGITTKTEYNKLVMLPVCIKI